MKKNSPLWARITRDIPPAGQGSRRHGGQPDFASVWITDTYQQRDRGDVRRRRKSVQHVSAHIISEQQSARCCGAICAGFLLRAGQGSQALRSLHIPGNNEIGQSDSGTGHRRFYSDRKAAGTFYQVMNGIAVLPVTRNTGS